MTSALVVDVVALAAMASRISEFGFTPNRVAALGENLILLANLAGTAWFYARFVFGGSVHATRTMADRPSADSRSVGGHRRRHFPASVWVSLTVLRPWSAEVASAELC